MSAPHALPPTTPDRRIPSLDGLRGISILLVLCGHASYGLTWIPQPILAYAGNGRLGVMVFFLLSGYLIYSLSVREVLATGRFDWRAFYLRRVLRIFPCFYVFILTVVVLRSLGLVDLSLSTLLSAATFTLNYGHLWAGSTPSPDYHVVAHYWTLALEEQFYLTWPVLMLLFLRRQLRSALVAVMLLAPVSRVACYYLMPESRGQLGMMFHTAFDLIAGGVLLGELLAGGRPREILLRLARQGWLVAGAIVFVLVLSPMLFQRWHGSYAITVGATLDMACLALIITAAVHYPGTLLHRLLNWRPLAFVGTISYSLYVWNNLFLYEHGWRVQQMPWNLLCLFALAIASHYLVERPFLRLKPKSARS
ncbi:MAG: acyltransferase [Verrucomicrobia bacterium]|nr:acyltransferase [Verrucomicrobiota bacterium]